MFDDDRIEARGEAIARDPALLPGPVAQATYAGATTTRTCGWAIPYSEGGFSVTVVRAEEAEVRELESALAGSADYAASRHGDVSVFSQPIPEGIGAYLAYGIEGSVWVIVDGTLLDATRAETIAAVVAATVIGSAP